LSYLADIVRVLVHTGQKFNFYDVLVMAIDEQVLREQVEKARHRLEHDPSIPVQRRLNFEMSVKNLSQSFGDRERVPKIQGQAAICGSSRPTCRNSQCQISPPSRVKCS